MLESQCAPFDSLAPTTVRVEDAWESLTGVPLEPIEVELDFEAGADPTHVFEPSSPPPPVPTALCAGHGCEP